MGTMCDQTMSMAEFGKGDRSKNSVSDEDEPSLTEDGGDGHHEAGRTKKGSPWRRVKWTDKMVKLMITAVSYIGEDSTSYVAGRRKVVVLQKKGKWKTISKVVAERGYHVSPQQCEDKFNDLNKRYKRLNDMLGRGTSCQVVENPELLDLIDYLSEKEKDDLALRSRDDHDEDDQDMETEDHDEFEENHASHGDCRGIHGSLVGPMKKLKQGQGQENTATFGNSLNCQEYNKSLHSHGRMVQSDANQALPENLRVAWLQKQWVESRSIQLEEQKLQRQIEMLEVEKQRFKWQKFSKKKDRELEQLKLENERIKLENERLAL
ncbi:hypothetical protein PIB30_056167 [Stylosanthes scabra]|uniref:Myb/SANT-like DNA-binding domain-containing protein n=1 Tax=Stylosanthes scabra TaxID=79078 RepID=A0ABU6RJY4_9FABA|nr:hypothetical protein [Stylosanthes scabra]